MKKRTILVLTLICVSLLFAEKGTTVLDKINAEMYDPDASIDHSPPVILTADGGRELGEILLTIDALALGIDGPSGLTWDGTYLYVMSLYNDMCYVVDPTVPSVINSFPTPPTVSFGIGQEQNLWMTCITTDIAYECTHAGTYTGNQFSCVSGGASWAGDGSEWWQDGEIWFIMIGGTKKAYKFAIPSGVVLDSIEDPVWTASSQRGLTYDPWNEKFWVGGWISDSVWEVDQTGARTGRSFHMDAAGMAYDWQSTLHPEPVLWICRQATDQIVMVDPDNAGIYNVWDFETGWQGWTHTNADTFPLAWAVKRSDLMGAPWQIPASGDSSMWIVSSYGVWVRDTALSPMLVPLPITDWLKYGVAYKHSAYNDFLEVGIRYFDGNTWNVAPLVTYTSDTASAQDSVDVSTYNSYQLIQIYFYYDDDNHYAFYAAFDNVSITALPAMHDVASIAVTSPPSGITTPGNYDVIGWIRNHGHFTETFDVTANVYDTTDAWNLVYTQTITLTNLPHDGDTLLNIGSVNLGESAYHTEIITTLSDDERPYNDTSSTYSTTLTTFDLVWDFETGWQGWIHTNGQPFPAGWAVMPSGYEPAWTPPDAGDSCLWIDSDSAGVLVQDTAWSPVIYPNTNTLYLKFGVGYNFYSAGERLEACMKYYDAGSATVVSLMTYTEDTGPMWELLDISGYNVYDSIQICFYYDADYCWYVAIDNVSINGDTVTGIADYPSDQEPLIFGIASNMPNPIQGRIPISYTITKPGMVSLKVYDRAGRLVETLIDNIQNTGTHTVTWNAQNVPNGVYFLRLEAEEKNASRKLILVR